jgi:hypothetical protein
MASAAGQGVRVAPLGSLLHRVSSPGEHRRPVLGERAGHLHASLGRHVLADALQIRPGVITLQ